MILASFGLQLTSCFGAALRYAIATDVQHASPLSQELLLTLFTASPTEDANFASEGSLDRIPATH